MERKRIVELTKRSQAELERTKSVPKKKDAKMRKKTLAVEWLWFLCTLSGSWLVANILESFVPAGVELIAIIIFALVYVIRLTIWSIRQMSEE